MNVIGADPYVLLDEKSGYYYCYATSNTGNNFQFYIYKSKDLIEWEHVGYALDTNQENNWGKDWFWAPECYYNPNNQHYYLFYSALVKDELVEKYFKEPHYLECAKIGVAVSSSPEGPFINLANHPIEYFPYDKDYCNVDRICDNVFTSEDPEDLLKKAPKGTYISSIDVNLFFDEDKIYLYYSRCCYHNVVYDKKLKKFIEESNILAVELETDWWFDKEAKMMPTIRPSYVDYNEDHTRRCDRFVEIINHQKEPQDWENGHIDDYETKHLRNRRWSEGSTTFVRELNHEKTYCITYSCNCFENALYGVGIAFAASPLGPFKKYDKNPIIHQKQEEHLYSTGHGTIIHKGDHMYYFFHGRDDVKKARILYVAEIVIHSKENVEVKEPTKCKLK